MGSGKELPPTISETRSIILRCQEALAAASNLDRHLNQQLNSPSRGPDDKLRHVAKEIRALRGALELVQAKAAEFPETLVRNHVCNVISMCRPVINEVEDLTCPSRWKDMKHGDVEIMQGNIRGSTSALCLALEALALRSAVQNVPRAISLEFKQASTGPEGFASTVTTEMKDLPREVTVRVGERPGRRGTARDSVTTATVNTITTQTSDNSGELRLQIIVGDREGSMKRYPPASTADHSLKDAMKERKQTKAGKGTAGDSGEDPQKDREAENSEWKQTESDINDEPTDDPDGSPQKAPQKWRSIRDVFLFKGHLILDMPCPRAIRTTLEIPTDARSEYSHLRFSAVTCSGEEFATDPSWKLRSSLFSQPRATGLFVSVALSKSSDLFPALQKIWATFDDMDHRARLHRHSSFKDDGWKHRVVHIHCPIYPDEEVQELFNEIGVRPKTPDRASFLDAELDSEVFSEMESVSGEDVLWYIYEYTAKLRLTPTARDGGMGKPEYVACLDTKASPVQIIVTNGRRQIQTGWGGDITISPPALFRPTWREVRQALSRKLGAKVILYDDGERFAERFGRDTVEKAWGKGKYEGMLGDVSGEASKPGPASRSKRWFLR